MTRPALLSRRAVLTGAAAALTLPAQAISREQATRAFDITRNGVRIGEHLVTVSRDRHGVVTARTDSDYRLKALGITIYRFQLRCTETWEEKRLVSLESRVDANGEDRAISVERRGDRLKITGGPRDRDAPYDSGTSCFVTPELLKRQRWVRSSDGELVAIRAYRGRSRRIIDTSCVSWRLADGFGYVRDLYYDARGEWLGMDMELRGEMARFRARSAYGELARIWAGL